MDVMEAARRIADEVLFPAAAAVDGAERLPVGHLDTLAEAGLYGLIGPVSAGGLDADFATFCAVVETLAGGCLATAFVWLQHHGAVRGLTVTQPSPLRQRLLPTLCSGERRAGVALGGASPAGSLRARPVSDGYVLDGVSPWVTGWDMIDTLYVAARGPGDVIVWAVIDTAGLAAEPLPLVAATASRTVELRCRDHFLPADRVVATEPYAEVARRDAAGLRVNGSLALGVTGRCCALIGPSPLDEQLKACREALDSATPDTLPNARAAAAELAVRAAATVATTDGSRAVLAGGHAERLSREALFLLVFGTRPAIRANLLQRLTSS